MQVQHRTAMYVHFLVAHQYQYHRNLRRCDDGNEFDGIIYLDGADVICCVKSQNTTLIS